MMDNGRMGRCLDMVLMIMKTVIDMKDNGLTMLKLIMVIDNMKIGILYCSNGDKYDGEWQNDEKNGIGK